MMRDVTHADIRNVIKTMCLKTMGESNTPDFWELDEIVDAVHDCCLCYSIDPVLCLAQGIAESHFAVNPHATRSRKHKNIFNWLNTDDGKNHTFATFEAGIQQYCKTMKREYFWANDQDADNPGWVTLDMMVRHDFMRPKGGRYASAKDYVRVITSLAKQITKIINNNPIGV